MLYHTTHERDEKSVVCCMIWFDTRLEAFILNILEICGVGLNLALLKDNSYGDPRFFFFFLKYKMIVH